MKMRMAPASARRFRWAARLGYARVSTNDQTGDYDWNSGAAQRTNVRPLNLYPTKIRA